MADEVKSGLIDWVKGQPFNNVLIMALLLMIGWLGFYGITSAIPEHIKAIQTGYERIETSHEKQIETITKTFETAYITTSNNTYKTA